MHVTIYTIKKNTQTLIEASKEVHPEVNAEKTKYMLLSRSQNIGQNHNSNPLKMWHNSNIWE
jgi:hypothetical protein